MSDTTDFDDLLDQIIAGEISQADRKRLETAMLNDPALRRRYLDLVLLDTELNRRADGIPNPDWLWMQHGNPSTNKLSDTRLHTMLVLLGFGLPGVTSLVSTVLPSNTLSEIDRLWHTEFLFSVLTSISLVALAVAGTLLRRFSRSMMTPMLIAALSIPMLVSIGGFLIYIRSSAESQKQGLIDRLAGVRWIAYDPREFDPYRRSYPSSELIERDLTILKEQGGFTGIITFGNNESLQEVPYIAKKLDLRVILGVWIPDDAGEKPIDEFERAEKAAADGAIVAICVGHVQGVSTDLGVVSNWMADLRRSTGLPVTHTAPIINYLGDRGKTLREIGDWYFPDVGGSFRDFNSVADAFQHTREDCNRVSELPADKPVLLKMIGYPSGPSRLGFTPEAQRDYYLRVMRDLNLPRHVYLSFAFAFDRPYVGRRALPRLDDRHPAGEFLGLFTADPIAPKPKKIVDDLRRFWELNWYEPNVPNGNYQAASNSASFKDPAEQSLSLVVDEKKYEFCEVTRSPQNEVALKLLARNGKVATTLYPAPYISGGDLGSKVLQKIQAESNNGVAFRFEGQVRDHLKPVGTWLSKIQLGLDLQIDHIIGRASTSVTLNADLASMNGDLNVLRFATTYLPLIEEHDPFGNRDPFAIEWSYYANNRRYDHAFVPTPTIADTYPTSRSDRFEVFVRSALVDPFVDNPDAAAGLNLRLSVTSEDGDLLTFGTNWDADSLKAISAAENLKITPLVLKAGATSTKSLSFEYWFDLEFVQ